MLRIIHKILAFSTTPSKRMLTNSRWLRFRWNLYKKFTQGMAECYTSLAISDFIELNDVQILHERRDHTFEQEIVLCGYSLQSYLHEHEHITHNHHTRVLKKTLFFSFFTWEDTISVNIKSTSTTRPTSNNTNNKTAPIEPPSPKSHPKTLLGKERLPESPQTQIEPDSPQQTMKPIKKKQFEIDTTF